ncbi:MAG: hypothetical protein LW860_00575 [Xanthomonadaceae bacterium]|jgi:hypothetical protein|nr:hypothetical protein [Xanthomonadaceae bacterium]
MRPLHLLGLAAAALAAPASAAPADEFLAALVGICGQAFAGRITANVPVAPDDPFVGQRLLMHVRECAPGAVRVPFHVGDDRSRTWVLTRTADGLRLAHDHRHADGTPDVLTMYGGDTLDPGSATRQAFPANAGSKALFEREGRAVSTGNTWTLEIDPGRRFSYRLARTGREFQVDFDLTRPVDPPPAPWGAN